ncbi:MULTISPECIES: glycosyltransferase family 4 protein [unclassified Leptolyngbya]|uniref:glycosyltransferase family 4 protein n=1 Tax=unclassified Leptolyngbya TaxID=2650499 RepID=UPI001686CF5D|nr:MULTISPECIES: glycosyltransferase family 4 protein [unclassified Leptolyngbya]MBD1913329.1 glycosyltransferase family 4 protein [Leptolyngbya sp. FACHB-8]MBD2154485.1 glycosyltransferase family 4 protein [Leptolyngbya sp. FACHB-16]
MSDALRILFLSTTVGPLGSGQGGGVELTLKNLAAELRHRGHTVTIAAPAGSVLDGFDVAQISGTWQDTAQRQERSDPIVMPKGAVLAEMWEYARQQQPQVDVLVNMAYDWLPFYLTPFFEKPIAHFVSMGSLTDAMDVVIGEVAARFPGTIAMHTKAQADTFPFADQCRILSNGLDLSEYTFQPQPDSVLGWVGRIAPEKALEDAIAASQQVGLPLRIWGAKTDEAYWQSMGDRFPDAPFEYVGFLSTAELQRELGKCQGLLMTPRWVEAFGNVAIEALACGVPVISYRRGGPAEIVQDGVTGYLVEPDSVDGLVKAIARLPHINRQTCRQQVEALYSREAMGDRMEQWLWNVYQNHRCCT